MAPGSGTQQFQRVGDAAFVRIECAPRRVTQRPIGNAETPCRRRDPFADGGTGYFLAAYRAWLFFCAGVAPSLAGNSLRPPSVLSRLLLLPPCSLVHGSGTCPPVNSRFLLKRSAASLVLLSTGLVFISSQPAPPGAPGGLVGARLSPSAG